MLCWGRAREPAWRMAPALESSSTSACFTRRSSSSTYPRRRRTAVGNQRTFGIHGLGGGAGLREERGVGIRWGSQGGSKGGELAPARLRSDRQLLREDAHERRYAGSAVDQSGVELARSLEERSLNNLDGMRGA